MQSSDYSPSLGYRYPSPELKLSSALHHDYNRLKIPRVSVFSVLFSIILLKESGIVLEYFILIYVQWSYMYVIKNMIQLFQEVAIMIGNQCNCDFTPIFLKNPSVHVFFNN